MNAGKINSTPNDLDDICLTDRASKPKMRRVTSEDVLQMLCDCLSLQRENLLLKKKKAYTTSAAVRAASAKPNLHFIVRDYCCAVQLKQWKVKCT